MQGTTCQLVNSRSTFLWKEKTSSNKFDCIYSMYREQYRYFAKAEKPQSHWSLEMIVENGENDRRKGRCLAGSREERKNLGYQFGLKVSSRSWLVVCNEASSFRKLPTDTRVARALQRRIAIKGVNCNGAAVRIELALLKSRTHPSEACRNF